MSDVEPRFKQPRKVKAARRSLRRVGKKMERDMDEMREVKRALLERSLGRCEAGFVLGCTGVGVHAHHVKRRSQGSDNRPESLLWVCEPCHQAIHHFPAMAMERGLLKAGWEE